MTKDFKFPLITVFFIGFLVDVFAFTTGSDLRMFALIGFWIFLIIFYKLKSEITLKVTIVYLIILFFLFIFARDQSYTDRVSTWIYLFLIIGLIQQFKEIKSS